MATSNVSITVGIVWTVILYLVGIYPKDTSDAWHFAILASGSLIFSLLVSFSSYSRKNGIQCPISATRPNSSALINVDTRDGPNPSKNIIVLSGTIIEIQCDRVIIYPDKGPRTRVMAEIFHSSLEIQFSLGDSVQYTCRAPRREQKTVLAWNVSRVDSVVFDKKLLELHKQAKENSFIQAMTCITTLSPRNQRLDHIDLIKYAEELDAVVGM